MSSSVHEIEGQLNQNLDSRYESPNNKELDEGTLKEHSETCIENKRNQPQIGRIEEICVKEEPVDWGEDYHHRGLQGDNTEKVEVASNFQQTDSLTAGVKLQPHSTSASCHNQYLNFGLAHFLENELCKEESGKVKYLQCSECPYQTRVKESLKTHIRTHTGERPFKCSYCSFGAARRNNLTTHLRTHTGEKPFKCPECSFCSASGSDLKRHIRIHTGEKPYICEVCSYSAAQRSRLNAHYRIHTGLKPYKCEFCSFTCSQRSHLTTHIRTHTGEKPFLCRVCPFTTAKSSHLRQHERIHTGEKPYECGMCPYRTARSSSLKRHLKTHAEEGKVEEICVKTESEKSAFAPFEN